MFSSLNRAKVIKGVLAVGVLLLSTSLLAFMVYRERDVLLNYNWALRWEYIVAAYVTTLAAMLLPAYVWTDMMRSLGSDLKRTGHFRYYFYAHVSRRLPGTIWYLLGRNYLYKQQGESARLVTFAGGVEFVVAVSSGAFVSLLFARFVWTQLSQIYLLLLFVALCLGAIATHPRTIQWSMHRLKVDLARQIRYRNIIWWFILYALLWVLGGVGLFLIANAVTVVLIADLPYVIASWCLVGTLSFLVFFLPTNFGITEVGLSLLLTAIMPSSIAVFIAIFSRLLLIAFEVITVGLLIGVTSIGSRNSAHNPSPPE